MLLSSEPLGARYRARARFYGQFAMTFVIAALLFNVFFGGFYVRRFMGETISIPITQLDHYTTHSDDGDVDRYRVRAKLPSGDSVLDHVNGRTFDLLRVGDVVPFRIVAGTLSDRSTIGPDVTTPFSTITIVPLLALLLFYYQHQEKKTRPWYDSKVVDTGTGRLESTLVVEQGRAFVPPK
jgi:hypothetical protein